ncbi:MAG: DUF4405 domain-containing protein [Anaerolineaceae bacterium]|nr:DUF4405 domain-containing protein [Anaerolineaceae bacterium]
MAEIKALSKTNRNNWLLDSLLALSGLVVGLTSIYFLFLPLNGYRGGRNPYHGLVILFDRHTWSDLHTWVGLAMIVIALVHFIIHFDWVVSMTKRVAREISGRKAVLNARGRFNVFVDAMIALGFFVSAITGLSYFLVAGENSLFTPGARMMADTTLLDLIHTWSGILMIVAAVVHFAIHWQWVIKTGRRLFHLREESKQLNPLVTLES